MNNEVNNINNSTQPNVPNPTVNVNQTPTGQVQSINSAPQNQTIVQPQTANSTLQSTPMVEPATNSAPQENSQTNVDPMSAVANLNKDEAMEEALSHTTQYSPFEAPKQEVNHEVKKKSNKSAYIFIGIIFAIMLLFIIFLPQISSLFGWV